MWKDNSDLGKMMHDFGCPDLKQMLDPVFAKRVAHVKSDKLVRRSMDDYEARKYRKAKRSGYKKGIKIGEAKGIKNTAIRMMESGAFTESEILKATGLTQEQLEQIKTRRIPQG